jgi:hypothetical protein
VIRRAGGRTGRRGNAAVEFAMTLPLLLLIVSAILDYGWYLTQAANVMHSVREGARYGVTLSQEDGPDAGAVDQTEAALRALGIDCGGLATCSVNATLGFTGGLNSLEVQAEIVYVPLMGIVPTPSVLQGSMTMALEDQG